MEGFTEIADYLKSLPQECKRTTIMSIHSLVQHSYSPYTAAMTGESDSRSEENRSPPPTKNRKGDLLLLIATVTCNFLIPPPVTSGSLSGQRTSSAGNEQPETTGRRLYYI